MFQGMMTGVRTLILSSRTWRTEEFEETKKLVEGLRSRLEKQIDGVEWQRMAIWRFGDLVLRMEEIVQSVVSLFGVGTRFGCLVGRLLGRTLLPYFATNAIDKPR